MKHSRPLQAFRRKLQITQTELGLLADVNKSMISHYEAGHKTLNLIGNTKIGVLLYALETVAMADQLPGVPTAADRSAHLNIGACERLLELHTLKLTRARKRLDALDTLFDELTETRARLAQLNACDKAIFTEDNHDWLRIVERRLELKAAFCSGEQRLKLLTQVAVQEATIEVLRKQLAVLVEADERERANAHGDEQQQEHAYAHEHEIAQDTAYDPSRDGYNAEEALSRIAAALSSPQRCHPQSLKARCHKQALQARQHKNIAPQQRTVRPDRIRQLNRCTQRRIRYFDQYATAHLNLS
jgi:DNA-binding XRE family transcriptional regulator